MENLDSRLNSYSNSDDIKSNLLVGTSTSTSNEGEISLEGEDKENSVPKAPCIEDFYVIKPISRGAFGKVFLGYKRSNPTMLYAIKVMRKSDMLNKNLAQQVTKERNALALSRSPFCVQLFYSLQTSTHVYLVMEYLIGGDLKSLLSHYGYFDEEMATFYISEVILALEYLHSHSIVHRDIKPDNMLLTAQGHVRLTDFGLSQHTLHSDLNLNDLANFSPNYISTRTPGQLISLTSHISFGSAEIKKSTGDFHSVANSFDSKCSEKDFSGFDPMQSLDDLPSGSVDCTETFNTCKSCCVSEQHCECRSKLDESFKLKRSFNYSAREVPRKRGYDPCDFTTSVNSSTGLTDAISLMCCTPKRVVKRTLNPGEGGESPLKSVLKKCMSGDYFSRQMVVSTPVGSAVKRSNSDSIQLAKRTRFNSEVETAVVDDPVLSPIATPEIRGGSSGKYRTPKSVKRNLSSTRVLGTPDYLAPELLVSKEHSAAVDWWSLGVCAYEFMVGVSPFNDNTVQAIFANILGRVLEWPEGEEALSDRARGAIESLLVLDPSTRADGATLQAMSLFENVPWDSLYSSIAPFVPQPDDQMDTSYFQPRNEMQHLKMSAFEV